MSRTTHQLNKAKLRVLSAHAALAADPQNLQKKLALVEAMDDLERDRNAVQGAILKSLITSNVQPTDSTSLTTDFAKHLGSEATVIKQKRLNMSYPGDQTKIFQTRDLGC